MVSLGIEIAKYIVEIKLNLVANANANANAPAPALAFSFSNYLSFIANATLLQNWTISELTFNYSSWSISAEFYTYAIFGIVMTMKSKKSRFIVPILLILISGLVVHHRGMYADNISGLMRCIYSVFIGGITFSLYKKFALRDELNTSFLGFFMLIFSIFFVVTLGDSKFGFVIIIPVIFAVTILTLISKKNTSLINRVLSNS